MDNAGEEFSTTGASWGNALAGLGALMQGAGLLLSMRNNNFAATAEVLRDRAGANYSYNPNLGTLLMMAIGSQMTHVGTRAAAGQGANFGLPVPGLFFTYHDGRVEPAPILPNSSIAFTSDEIQSGRLPEIAAQIGQEFSLGYNVFGDSSTAIGSAYITIRLLQEELGYTPSYAQLFGALWASEGGAVASTASGGGIGAPGVLGDDLATVIAHRVQSACEGTNVVTCQPAQFLYSLGSYFEAFNNAKVSDLAQYLSPTNGLYGAAQDRGVSIFQESSQVFSSVDPFFYGPSDADYPGWDALRVYNLSSVQLPSQAVWSSTGLNRMYPDGTVVNETVDCSQFPTDPACS